MYTFIIQDSKGGCMEYEHITKVVYNTAASTITLEGDNIFTHMYKTSHDLHLFSETDAYTISNKSIELIQVSKEN